MKNIIYIVALVVLLSGCELIVIGNPSLEPRIVEINQNSSIGAVYLFKTELDSHNIPAATQILANQDGSSFLAFEKYEMYYDIERIHRIISNRPVTNISIDTLSSYKKTFSFEFDYLETMSFTTRKIDDEWFIVDISNWSEITKSQVKIKNFRK